MITVDISDWAAVATMLGVGITVLGVLTRKIDAASARATADNRATREELGARINEVNTDLGNRINQVNTDLGDRINQVETGLGHHIDKVETGLGNRIDKVDAKIDKAREESRADVADLRNDFRFLSQTIVDFLAHPPQRHAPRAQGE